MTNVRVRMINILENWFENYAILLPFNHELAMCPDISQADTTQSIDKQR